MFEPTGWAFLGALAAGFVCLAWWLSRARNVATKVIAGLLAFALSTVFGIGLVNQYYAYYTTWGALVASATGGGVGGYNPGYAPRQRPSTVPDALSRARESAPAPGNPSPARPEQRPAVPVSIAIGRLSLHAARTAGGGRVVRLELPGTRSGVSREGFVYLPPQYFELAYAHTAFPAIELLQGDPGSPAIWLYSLRLRQVMDAATDAGALGPMVVVMPATFTGKHGHDCVNVPHGPQDDTYLATDVPDDVMRDFRVMPRGPNWAIGGLSDGGFCAANLALRHPGYYGAVASLDGFYSPRDDLAVMNKTFGAGSPAIEANDPTALALTVDSRLPRFWLMYGTGDKSDSEAAAAFRSVLTRREPIDYVIVPHGIHTPLAWRAALPSMLEWTWNTISGGPVGVGTTYVALSSSPAAATASFTPRQSPAVSTAPTPLGGSRARARR